MEMKRIQFRLKCPNPLFERWLGELYQSAVAANNSTQIRYKKALQSLKRYPLVLKSGSECAILRGFGPKLCNILDRKLAKHRSQPVSSNVSIVAKTKIRSRRYSICVKNDNVPPLEYTPEVRSEAYAVLVTILLKTQENNINKTSVSINELEDNIQQHCNKQCFNDKLKLNAKIWSCISDLIQKELIRWKMDSNDFTLTVTGKCLAMKLIDNGLAKEVLVPKQNSPILVVNDEIKNNFEEFERSSNTDSEKIKPPENMNSQDVLSSDDDFSDTIFQPDSFDVLLLVDKQEIGGARKKSDPTVSELNKFGMMEYEMRHLKVGDFIWIARHFQTKEELVLPYIVERKRIDDLGKSIKDGRFHEQKFRLKQCGIPNVIYMIEYYGENQRIGLPISTLMQAATNTRIQEGFLTHYTSSLPGSIKFLAMMTKNLENKYKGKTLRKCKKDNTGEKGETTFLMSFSDFNKSSSKSKTLSVSDMFIKQLLQLKGISIEKALSIVSLYKTPLNLIKAYEGKDKPDTLLSIIKNGESKSSIGPAVSKSIYKYYTTDVLT